MEEKDIFFFNERAAEHASATEGHGQQRWWADRAGQGSAAPGLGGTGGAKVGSDACKNTPVRIFQGENERGMKERERGTGQAPKTGLGVGGRGSAPGMLGDGQTGSRSIPIHLHPPALATARLPGLKSLPAPLPRSAAGAGRLCWGRIRHTAGRCSPSPPSR